MINKPEGFLEREFTKKGRIEHHFVAVDSVSIVFIEVKKAWTLGKSGLDVKAQVLAECAGMLESSLLISENYEILFNNSSL